MITYNKFYNAFGGKIIMQAKQIKLQATESVKDFVNAATKCDFDIDIFYNRVIIDAKSFLGVLSLDLSRTLNVICRGYDSEFEGVLKKYESI
jgi:phosphocarrier protein HPr